MTALFDSPKLKVERATRHINELHEQLQDFIGSDFYRLVIDKDPKDGNSLLVVEMTKLVPAAIPLALGDAIHNLRASLDILICDIFRHADKRPTRHTAFPIRKSKDELIKAIDQGGIKAFPSVADAIMNLIKPYPGGNDALVGLHDLDIQDKHRLITPVFAVTELVGVSAIDSNHNRFVGMTLSFSDGGRMLAIQNSADMRITNYGQPAFDVRFEKGEPFEFKSVISTLRSLSNEVLLVIERIESAFSKSL